MSIKRMSAVWKSSKHKGSALLLMLALADSADDVGMCWPGYKYLAEKIRMGRDSVIRLVNVCDKSGELWKLNRSNQRSNVYIVTVGLSPDELEEAWDKAVSFGVRTPTGSRKFLPPPQVLEVVGNSYYLDGNSAQVVGNSDKVVGSILLGGRIAIIPDPSLSVLTPKEKIWKDILKELEGQMTKATFDAHLRGSRLVSSENGQWQVAVFNETSVDWLNNRLRETVNRAVANHTEAQVAFIGQGKETA